MSQLIDHNGNFTLFNAETIGVVREGIESVHKNEKDEVIKEGSLNTDINYIFYTSEKINEDYKFFIYDEKYGNKTELNIIFGFPENDLDDENVNYFNDEEKIILKIVKLMIVIVKVVF